MITVKASRKEIAETLYRRGELSFILYPHQRAIYRKMRDVINSSDIDANSYVLDVSRQYGKSFCMFMIACEECIRRPYVTVVYIAPLKKQVIEIVTENTFRKMFELAPKNLVPILKDSELVFSNGSRIRLAGTDGKNYDSLRGGSAHLILLDEAGFMSDLDTGVMPTILPMTKTTGGKVIFASTPPQELGHPYYDILREHDENGNISTFTIHDDKSLTPKQFATIVSACKGQDTTIFKREYECQRIAESSMQVIPELNDELSLRLRQPVTYKESEFLPFWQKYVVADTGVRDKTAVIFAHYNYRTKKVIVEDTLDLQGKEYNTSKLAHMIKDKTNSLWSENFVKSPIRYIADSNNLVVINDLNIIYGLPFIGTSKGRLDEMVQKVRDWIYDERILFTDDALEVLHCAHYAVWARNRNEFGRSKRFGHYDSLASLTYLIRNIDEVTDPVPRMHNLNPHTMHISKEYHSELAGQARELQNIFNPRSGASFRR